MKNQQIITRKDIELAIPYFYEAISSGNEKGYLNEISELYQLDDIATKKLFKVFELIKTNAIFFKDDRRYNNEYRLHHLVINKTKTINKIISKLKIYKKKDIKEVIETKKAEMKYHFIEDLSNCNDPDYKFISQYVHENWEEIKERSITKMVEKLDLLLNNHLG